MDPKTVLAALEGHGITAKAIKSDATKAPAVNKLFDDVLTQHGRLDIVVHTPGAVLRRPLRGHLQHVDLADARPRHPSRSKASSNTPRSADSVRSWRGLVPR